MDHTTYDDIKVGDTIKADFVTGKGLRLGHSVEVVTVESIEWIEGVLGIPMPQINGRDVWTSDAGVERL